MLLFTYIIAKKGKEYITNKKKDAVKRLLIYSEVNKGSEIPFEWHE